MYPVVAGRVCMLVYPGCGIGRSMYSPLGTREEYVQPARYQGGEAAVPREAKLLYPGRRS